MPGEVITTHKVFHDGGHYLSTPYSFDPERRGVVDRFFKRGENKGLKADRLISFVKDGFIGIYGADDYYVPQLDEQICRKMRKRKPREPHIYDSLFEVLFMEAFKAGLTHDNRAKKIKAGLTENFGKQRDFDDYIEQNVARKLGCMRGKLRRFEFKSFLNSWTHFVTITYDSKKFDGATEKEKAEDFRAKLKKTFSNFKTRRGWKYMGVFEHGKEKERLHFHAIVCIPDGELPGTLNRVRRWSTKQHKLTWCIENDFFKDAYGNNDFSPVTADDMKPTKLRNNHMVKYILKYMHKDEETIVYSRGVPAYDFKVVSNNDCAAEITAKKDDFVLQWVLFDDCISDDHPAGEPPPDWEPSEPPPAPPPTPPPNG